MNRWQAKWFSSLHAHSKLLYIHVSENSCKDCWFEVSMANVRVALKPLTDAEIKAAFKEIALLCEITPDKKKMRPMALKSLETLPFDEAELKKARKRFIKPTIEEIKLILSDDSLCQKFYNHYESNGWVVGKTKMIDWKAAANNWKIQFEEKNRLGGSSGKYPNSFSQKFQDTLQGSDLSGYWTHLRSLGLVPKKDRFDKTIDWVKA